jgi:hypothetical protein
MYKALGSMLVDLKEKKKKQNRRTRWRGGALNLGFYTLYQALC